MNKIKYSHDPNQQQWSEVYWRRFFFIKHRTKISFRTYTHTIRNSIKWKCIDLGHTLTYEFAFNLNWFDWIRWWQKCVCVFWAPWKFLLSHWKFTHLVCDFGCAFLHFHSLCIPHNKKNRIKKKYPRTQNQIFDRCVTRSIDCKVYPRWHTLYAC